MINDTQLLKKQDLREKFITQTTVLDKVKDLILLPNTEFATTEQVANYYEVTKEVIWSLVHDHRDEIESDGYKIIRRSDINENFEIPLTKFKSMRGKTVITFTNGEKFNVTNTGMALFPKRAILRVGMLLRDSVVAKEIRTRLLNIVQDTQENAPEIVDTITSEIDTEKALMLDRIAAEVNGDFDKVCVINAKLFALKNKRIAKLENDIENITTHSLTITESRSIINRLTRKIATEKYGSLYAKAWNELYKMANYKLGINVKSRNKQKGESYLTVLSDEETFKLEQMVRTWANAIGLNVDDLLKIA